ncbi:MAG TPA: glycosyltransferase, partial [Flavisolibacter sp.]|nr:glycosyltransferase [Flavisolibacter sp.]
MRSQTAVLTTVFPQVLPFLEDLIKSLLQQTVKHFDLIIINDGVSVEQLNRVLPKQLNWVNLPMNGLKPTINRWEGIQYCKSKGYQYIIFQDADDWMSENRIESSLSMLQKEAVVFSDLNLVTESGQLFHDGIWSSRFDTVNITHDFLKNKNCIGLGNAAALASTFPSSLVIPESVIAVDWFIFYHILADSEAGFVKESQVFYRQYANNTAGIGQLSEIRVRKAIEVKKTHYAALISKFPTLNEEYQKLLSFEEDILNKPGYLNEYLFTNKNKGLTSFWWEETNFKI